MDLLKLFNVLDIDYSKSRFFNAKLFLKLYLICYLFIFISVIIMTFIDSYITKILKFESIKELLRMNSKLTETYPFYFVVLLIPLLEELLFRLILKINRLNLSVFLFPFTFQLVGGRLTGFEFQTQFKFLLFSVIVSIISFYVVPDKLLGFINKKIKILIIFSIISFGLIHITNIKILHWELSLFYPFFVLPQLIIGYFITNVRLKSGFIWGFAFHALINLVPFLISKSM